MSTSVNLTDRHRPCQVWSWDITLLPGPGKGARYHLYVILDIYSRYAVGWLLATRECSELAARLIRETCAKHDVQADRLTIHSDRGPAMKAQTVAQLLAASQLRHSRDPRGTDTNSINAPPAVSQRWMCAKRSQSLQAVPSGHLARPATRFCNQTRWTWVVLLAIRFRFADFLSRSSQEALGASNMRTIFPMCSKVAENNPVGKTGSKF